MPASIIGALAVVSATLGAPPTIEQVVERAGADTVIVVPEGVTLFDGRLVRIDAEPATVITPGSVPLAPGMYLTGTQTHASLSFWPEGHAKPLGDWIAPSGTLVLVGDQSEDARAVVTLGANSNPVAGVRRGWGWCEVSCPSNFLAYCESGNRPVCRCIRIAQGQSPPDGGSGCRAESNLIPESPFLQ